MVEVLSGKADIAEFYTEIAPSEEFEVLQAIEHDLLLWYRRCNDETDGVVSNQAIFVQRDRLLEAIHKFRDIVDSNERFTKYKVLVGFESVFPQSWENDGFEPDDEDKYRTECIDAYVEQITDANAADWLGFIRRCAATETNDGATFRFFRHFLERVGERKAEFTVSFLEGVEGSLARFLVHLLNGLARTNQKSEADKRISEWIETGKFSLQIAQHFQVVSSFDFDFLRKLQDRAIAHGDTETVLSCLEVVFGRRNEVTVEMEEDLIHPAFQHLTEHKNANWIKFDNVQDLSHI